MTQDEDHLRLLSIFHYVVGGLAALFSLFPIFHMPFGTVLAVFTLVVLLRESVKRMFERNNALATPWPAL